MGKTRSCTGVGGMGTRAPDAVPGPRARAEGSGSLGGGGQKSSLLQEFQAGLRLPCARRAAEVGKDKSRATGHHEPLCRLGEAL